MGRKRDMSEREPKAIILQMLAGFAYDPPDSEYQKGFRDAVFQIGDGVLGIPYDELTAITGEEYGRQAKERMKLTIINGDKE
jgi:hypothetical protein